jgi:LDH2 family malate/lactate/ureidoglycolate dehydrogenase
LVTSTFAMRQAMTKARLQGIGLCTVRNSCHFGAAGYYAWLAAREGFIGLSMANDIPTVAAPGSRRPVTGSNPFSYAVPAGRYPPLLLDMSIATVALGKVFAMHEKGEPIPANWIVDGNGQPTTDPSGLPRQGALLPAAGHKGYGLALLIETLAGLLSGAGFTSRVGSWLWDDGTKPTHHGAAFIAIDVNALMPSAQFLQRVETLIEEIHSAPRAVGVDRLYVPGEMEWERHDRALKQGIPLPDDVVASLRTAAGLVGLKLPSEVLA